MLSRRLLSVAAGCALFAVSGAWAQEVVWDSPPNNDFAAFVDQEFGAADADFRTYLVGHVRLERDTFIHDITTYFTNLSNLWPQGQIEAVLNIIPQGEGLPPNDYDPTSQQLGGDGLKSLADLAGAGNGLTLTTHLGGGLKLSAGNYWIGLTPKLTFEQFGHEFHLGTLKWDKNTAGRNPGGGYGVGTDWFEAGPVFGGIDWGMAITITGKIVGGTVSPDSFDAFRGFQLSGDLDDVLESDDSDLCYNPGITLFLSEAPVTLDFTGTLPNDSPASLDVTIESSANTVGLELTVSFWNYNTESWDVVGVEEQTFAGDTVKTFAGTPADHVEPGAGEVRTRYEVRQVSFIFLFPWTDCVDHVFWTTTN